MEDYKEARGKSLSTSQSAITGFVQYVC